MCVRFRREGYKVSNQRFSVRTLKQRQNCESHNRSKTLANELVDYTIKTIVHPRLHRNCIGQLDDRDYKSFDYKYYILKNGKPYLNPEILTNDELKKSRGIYIFYVSSPFLTRQYIPVYVGRARFFDKTYDIQQRIRMYAHPWKSSISTRTKVIDMINTFYEVLHVTLYIPKISDRITNKDIEEHERDIIDALQPVFNTEFYAKEIKEAKKLIRN